LEVDAKGPTTSPTAAPTPAPTTRPTYKGKPTVTVVGGNIITLETTFSGQQYEDKGATCYDLEDGDISHRVKASDTVDLGKVGGVQIVTYSCKNSEGATQYAKRYVYVTNGACPHCTLLGNSTMSIEASFPYLDEGVHCTDNFPHPELQYTHVGHVDVEKTDTYRVTYIATDRAGNTNMHCGQAPVIRTVTVKDTLLPVIGLTYRDQSLVSLTSPRSTTPAQHKNPAVDFYAGLMAENKQFSFGNSLVLAIVSVGCGIALLVRLLRTQRNPETYYQQPQAEQLTRLI